MFYVYFNRNDGSILKVTNELSQVSTDYGYFEIDQEIYTRFISGKIPLAQCIVAPGKVKGEFELIEKHLGIDFDIEKSIHELVKIKSKLIKHNIFYIIQNQKKKEWQARAKLTDQYIEFLVQYLNIEKKQKIYVTEENNPNVLLDVLEFPLANFKTNKTFLIKKDYNKIIDRTDISLYCYVKYEDYCHRIVE